MSAAAQYLYLFGSAATDSSDKTVSGPMTIFALVLLLEVALNLQAWPDHTCKVGSQGPNGGIIVCQCSR